MDRSLATLLLSGATVITAGPIHAGPASDGEPVPLAQQNKGTPVSLERVLELARESVPAIAGARARVVQAEGQGRADRRMPDPEITAGVGRAEPRGGGTSANENSFAVSQTLIAPWGARARKRSAMARVESAEADVDATVADVLLEAKRLYYEAAIDEAQARALAEAADDARSLQELVGNRVDAGESPEGDRLRTRVEALRAQLEARSARSEADGTRARLNRFLLGALGPDFALSTELDPRSLSAPPDNFIETAVARNPDYRAALSRVDSAKWVLSKERAARVPSLDLSAFTLKELDRQATGLTFGIAIPLWNRNEGAVLASRGALAEAESEALQARVRIESELERLIRRDQVARELATGYSELIIPASTESLAIARFSLEQGEASLLAWLEARRSYLEVLRASYGARLDAFVTRAELERLTGDLDAAHH